MPLPFGPCDIPLDVCCTSLFDVAEHVLDIVLPAVNDCLTPSECSDTPMIAGYVSMGTQIQDPVADYVVVSLQTISTSPGSRDAVGRMQLPMYRATYQVRLLETGWPTAESSGEEIWVPSPEQVHDISRHAYAHGERMFRALADALVRKTLGPGACTFTAIGQLFPIEPSGGTVGWQTTVEIGIPFR